MHDTNTGINDMQRTEERCNNAVVDPTVASRMAQYWALGDNISIEDGCNAYLGMLIILPNLRKSCMESLHRGHPGMSKMCLRTKQSLYWPGINEEIRNRV